MSSFNDNGSFYLFTVFSWAFSISFKKLLMVNAYGCIVQVYVFSSMILCFSLDGVYRYSAQKIILSYQSPKQGHIVLKWRESLQNKFSFALEMTIRNYHVFTYILC